MSEYTRPKVYISYTWLNGKDEEGNWMRVPDERAQHLAERLREAGFDSRLDVYFHHSRYGFAPPQRRSDDRRDPWIIWAEEQITESDCVLLLCTPEYVASDTRAGECPGEWCNWHLLDDSLKFNDRGWPAMFDERRPAMWWDWHCIAREADTKPEKYIPVGFGPYNPQLVPAF